MTINLNRRHFMGGVAFGSAALAVGQSGTALAQSAAGAMTDDYSYLYLPDAGTALLSRNENPYGPSQKAIAAISEASTVGGCRYADKPLRFMTAMIAERFGVEKEGVMIGTGSGEVLNALSMGFADKGHTLAPDLFWDTTAKYGERNTSSKIVRVGLKPNMLVDLAAFKDKLDDSIGLVHLVNPNNPTGEVIPGETIRAFVKEVSKTHTVLVDEAYNEITDDPDGTSVYPLIAEGHDVIVARTFSKIYGMAGMRMGYTISSPDNAARIAKYKMSWPSIAATAGAIASFEDQAFMSFSKARITEARQMIEAACKTNGLDYVKSGTNFMYVNVKQDANKVRERMASKGVMIRGVYQDYTNWSRVSCGILSDVERYCANLGEAVQA